MMDRVTRATAQAPAVPEDLDTVTVEKAADTVELPLHIRWNGPRRVYDLADRHDRARVYEQVLREGNDSAVRRFIRGDDLWISGTSWCCPGTCVASGPTGYGVIEVSRSLATAASDASNRIVTALPEAGGLLRRRHGLQPEPRLPVATRDGSCGTIR